MTNFLIDENGELIKCISDAEEITVPENIRSFNPSHFEECKNFKKLSVVSSKFDGVLFDNLKSFSSVGIRQVNVLYAGKAHQINFPDAKLLEGEVKLQPYPYAFSWEVEYELGSLNVYDILRIFSLKYLFISGEASADYIRYLDYCNSNKEAKSMISQHVGECLSDILHKNENKFELINGVTLKVKKPDYFVPEIAIKLSGKVKWHQGYYGYEPFDSKIKTDGFFEVRLESDEIRELQIQLIEMFLASSNSRNLEAERAMLKLLRDNYEYTLKNDMVTLENLHTNRKVRKIFSNEVIDSIINSADDLEKVKDILDKLG